MLLLGVSTTSLRSRFASTSQPLYRSACDFSGPHGDRRCVDPIPAWSNNGDTGAGRSGGFLSTQNIRRCYNFPGPLLIPIPWHFACPRLSQLHDPSNLLRATHGATDTRQELIPADCEVLIARSILGLWYASAAKRSTRRELQLQAPCIRGDMTSLAAAVDRF